MNKISKYFKKLVISYKNKLATIEHSRRCKYMDEATKIDECLNPHAAIRAYKRLAKIRSEYEYANDQMAFIFQQYLNDYKRAIKLYQKILKINPHHEHSYYMIGRCLLYQKKYLEAMESFNKSIMINPKNSNAYMSRAKIHEELGESAKAEHEYNKAIAIEPENYQYHLDRANLRAYMYKYELGINDFIKATKLMEKQFNKKD